MEWQCAARIMSSGGHSSGVIDGRRQDAHRRRPRDVSLRLNETTSRAACGTAVQEEPDGLLESFPGSLLGAVAAD